MKEYRTLNTLNQIKAMAHPLRMRLLEAFSRTPLTTKQVAELLDEQPTKLYHHVSSLERAGLIKLIKTRKNRGTLEKYYRTAATRFTIDRRLFDFKSQAKDAVSEIQTVISSIFEETLSEMRQGIAERSKTPAKTQARTLLSRSHIWVSPEKIKLLNMQISKILKHYETRRPKKGAVKYGLTLVVYPVREKKK
jgi:DNA-binding transcriptional ArsR family regulator